MNVRHERTGDEDWTAPGAFEVAPGIYRIPLPLPNDGLRAVNVYAIVDGERLVFIDGGWAIAEAATQLKTSLDAVGFGLSDIERFLVTHAHRDHYTQAVTLRRELQTPIALGAKERPSLEAIQRPGREAYVTRLEQLRLYGAGALADRVAATQANQPEPDRSEWESPDVWLEEGPLALGSGRRLDVVETPGHTRGHVVFHDASAGLLFAGDHVLPRITPSIGFEPVLSDNPLGDFLGSLARVRRMPDAALLPAHGPVAGSVHARVDELVDHHGRRLDQAFAALEDGATTVFEVAGVLRWTRRERSLGELDVFNQMLAIAETGAHLALQHAQGRVTREIDAGCYRYLPST